MDKRRWPSSSAESPSPDPYFISSASDCERETGADGAATAATAAGSFISSLDESPAAAAPAPRERSRRDIEKTKSRSCGAKGEKRKTRNEKERYERKTTESRKLKGFQKQSCEKLKKGSNKITTSAFNRKRITEDERERKEEEKGKKKK